MLSIRRLTADPTMLDALLEHPTLGLRWAGQLVDDPELNLAGVPASIAHAHVLARGCSPLVGTLLKSPGTPAPGAPRAGADSPNLGRGIGFDVVMPAPLGLSMLVGVVNAQQREELLAAHRQAVDATVRFLEDQIHHRFIVLQVDLDRHDGEAFVHTHNVIFSVSRIAGAWSPFFPRELHRHVGSAAALYQATLAKLTPYNG